MEGFINIVAVVLVIAYIGTAIWIICKMRTIRGSISVSAGFFCGGFVIIPIAEAIATFVCWAMVIGIALCILGTMFGS